MLCAYYFVHTAFLGVLSRRHRHTCRLAASTSTLGGFPAVRAERGRGGWGAGSQLRTVSVVMPVNFVLYQ
jgi:hypothetical protein